MKVLAVLVGAVLVLNAEAMMGGGPSPFMGGMGPGMGMGPPIKPPPPPFIQSLIAAKAAAAPSPFGIPIGPPAWLGSFLAEKNAAAVAAAQAAAEAQAAALAAQPEETAPGMTFDGTYGMGSAPMPAYIQELLASKAAAAPMSPAVTKPIGPPDYIMALIQSSMAAKAKGPYGAMPA